MTGGPPGYVSPLPDGRDSFWQLVHSELTKIRSVRGWLISLVVAVALTLGISFLGASGAHSVINGRSGHSYVPVGPGGEAVTDTFYFVHQPLAGDGTITARVTALVGASSPVGARCTPPPAAARRRARSKARRPAKCQVLRTSEGQPAGTPSPDALQPWTKAGLIVTASTKQGSAYAAVMVTPAHGLRMQWDYTNDVAGMPGTVSERSPRWLRLTRAGDTVTGYDSTDGRHWTQISSVVVPGLPATVQVGLFVTSPQITVLKTFIGGSTAPTSPSIATATFDQVKLEQSGSTGAWQGLLVGAGSENASESGGGGYVQSAGTFTVSGSGDIAPAVGGPSAQGVGLEQSLIGGFAGLIVVIVLGTLFVTDEYRRGLIRTTLSASPRRGPVLAAKAIVIGGVSFVVGLVAFTVAITVGGSMLRANGNYVYPVRGLTEIRMVVGLSLMLAAGAVLALGMGTVLRRGAGVIAALVALFVLPEFLSTSAILPAGAAEWLLRVTPAAGFAIQQSIPQYAQVASFYTPAFGYYPLLPWAGLLVLGGYATVALGLATFVLRRRDA
jgi:ABC-type transport system involved in multi-copper enzyme maturation permease subunit